MKDYLKQNNITDFLKKCQKAYVEGNPIIPDNVFDTLANTFNYYEVGAMPTNKNKNHLYRMYSLQKVYEEDNPTFPVSDPSLIESPKLDGSAISILYIEGSLTLALTRGDGIVGEDITTKIVVSGIVPLTIDTEYSTLQITGEVVASKEIENSRNYVAGALHLKDLEEFKTRRLSFIAYGMEPTNILTYSGSMKYLKSLGFDTVLDKDWKEYPQDGKVVRVDSNSVFNKMGYTSNHPRGAWAIKRRADVAVVPTVLREVRWQLGKGGKVTPVALFDTVVIEDANISKATLHNAGFIENMDLNIGDTILITRSGGIIPKVVGKI